MTVTMIVTLKKKPDLTVEQFRHHYETSHGELVKKYGGHLFEDYRRYCVNEVYRLDRSPIGAERLYDAITVFKFKHQLDCDTWLRMMETTETRDVFRADEEKFLDRSQVYAYFANEVRTWVADDLRQAPAQRKEPLNVTMIATLKRRADLSPMQFRYHYESSHVMLAKKFGGHLIEDYRRYYPYAVARAGGALVTEERAYDDITIMKFKDEAAREGWYHVMDAPESADLFLQDEYRFLDRSQVFAYSSVEVKA